MGVASFTYSGPGKEVKVAGSFNDWKPQPMINNQLQLEGIPAGDHQYKFLVDGVWELDPKAEKGKDANGIENSLVTVLKPKKKKGKKNGKAAAGEDGSAPVQEPIVKNDTEGVLPTIDSVAADTPTIEEQIHEKKAETVIPDEASKTENTYTAEDVREFEALQRDQNNLVSVGKITPDAKPASTTTSSKEAIVAAQTADAAEAAHLDEPDTIEGETAAEVADAAETAKLDQPEKTRVPSIVVDKVTNEPAHGEPGSSNPVAIENQKADAQADKVRYQPAPAQAQAPATAAAVAASSLQPQTQTQHGYSDGASARSTSGKSIVQTFIERVRGFLSWVKSLIFKS